MKSARLAGTFCFGFGKFGFSPLMFCSWDLLKRFFSFFFSTMFSKC